MEGLGIGHGHRFFFDLNPAAQGLSSKHSEKMIRRPQRPLTNFPWLKTLQQTAGNAVTATLYIHCRILRLLTNSYQMLVTLLQGICQDSGMSLTTLPVMPVEAIKPFNPLSPVKIL